MRSFSTANLQASGHYDIQLAQAEQIVTITIAQSIPHAPCNDQDMLLGALAQTCLALSEKETQIQCLKEQLAVTTKQLFGTASEKKQRLPEPEDETVQSNNDLHPNGNSTPAMPTTGIDGQDENVIPFNRRSGRKPLAPELPRSRKVHPLSADTCPQCQGSLRPLPSEITEQMIVVPARYEVVQHIRHKAVCRCCDTFLATPMPKAMIEGSSYGSASFLAHIGCNKYQLGLPYYRQEKLFHHSHVPVNRTTMANLMNTCADRCVALFALLKEWLLRQLFVHADETTLQVLKEPNRLAASTSYMWLYCSAAHATHPVILFDYQETRSGEHPRAFLAGFTGYLQTDGYSGYHAIKGVKRVGCMAHLRRGFVKALDVIPKEQRSQAKAAWVIDQIGMLYGIEKQIAHATTEQRQQARQQYSLPVMNTIKAWLDLHEPSILPKSLLGKAINYALNQWERVIAYLDDGRIAIDNNIAERAIKDLVIGRKAWLFADRPEGAHTIAVMHSLVQTAVANGLDPYQYLVHIFEVMPTLKTSEELKQLLPWNVVLPDRLVQSALAA